MFISGKDIEENLEIVAKSAGKFAHKAALKATLFAKRKLMQTKLWMELATTPVVRVVGNGVRKPQNVGRKASGTARSFKDKFSIRKKSSELKCRIKNLAMKPFHIVANALRKRLMQSKYGKMFLNSVKEMGHFMNGVGKFLNLLNL